MDWYLHCFYNPSRFDSDCLEKGNNIKQPIHSKQPLKFATQFIEAKIFLTLFVNYSNFDSRKKKISVTGKESPLSSPIY